MGKSIPYSYYFRNQPKLETVCGIRSPDVVFDLAKNLAPAVTSNGYQIISRIEGEFLAVRSDLIPYVTELVATSNPE
ncbi:MAG: hypothetical protein IH914_10115 [candidate division Zixibacteria bacterium]|nr:hypothetical protein [candidate division Zixibacteria bacterium]